MESKQKARRHLQLCFNYSLLEKLEFNCLSMVVQHHRALLREHVWGPLEPNAAEGKGAA